jgi:flagellar hook assembly protein FlgD
MFFMKKNLSLTIDAFIPRQRFQLWISAVALLITLIFPRSILANVYATNIRLNDGATNATSATATNVNIGYILNEAATAGVVINITSGDMIVRTISITNPDPGTVVGTNIVAWDGKDNDGMDVGLGSYTISITASANGYTEWTPISDDNNVNNYVWAPRGVAVNRNPSSLFYGRVFLANAFNGPNPDTIPGDMVGMLKLNADSSPAEEGIGSTGGWNWAGDEHSPWKIEVADDDRVFISDASVGAILSFDELLSTNSLRIVLTTNNFPSAVNTNLSGPFITGSGTNMQLWVADTNYPGSLGIRRWQVGSNGVVATNDPGITIVRAGGAAAPTLSSPSYAGGQFKFTLNGQANATYVIQASTNLATWTPVATNISTSATQVISIAASPGRNFYRATTSTSSDLNLAPYDLAVDSSNRIYTIQFRTDNGDPSDRIFRFPAYGGTPLSIADWKTGGGDDTLEGAQGIAVDAQGRYVAVAFFGDLNGAARVFESSNGAPVATLTIGTSASHTDVAWDNVGNLYTTDDTDSVLRIYSPPGTNQATTVAIPKVHIGIVLTPPVLNAPSYAAGQFSFTLNGQTDVSYIIQNSLDLKTWSPVVTNTSASAIRQISVSAAGNVNFFRAIVAE